MYLTIEFSRVWIAAIYIWRRMHIGFPWHNWGSEWRIYIVFIASMNLIKKNGND